jgi:hypothetical protein
VIHLLLSCLLIQGLPQAAPPTTGPAGSALLRGLVIDKASGEPLPRAVVSLRNVGGNTTDQKYTDDRGRFEFASLVAGQYELRAAAGLYRTTHVAMSHPETKDGIGPLLSVKEGEQQTGIVIALPRALAINGRVIDEAGRPLAQIGLTVIAARGSPFLGSSRQRTTDDRGMFRLHGLPPGTYTVCAEPRGGPNFEPQPRRRLRYMRTCYPAASDPAEATEITLIDEDVSGIELRLPRRQTFVIGGAVIMADGSVPANAMVSMVRFEGSGASGTSAQLQPSGTFALSNVTPGRYELSARIGRDSRGPFPDDRPPQWGSVPVEITTADAEGLLIVLRPAVTLKGRVVFEDPPQAPLAAPLRISATPVLGVFDRPRAAAATVADDGSFELKDLFGAVTLRADGPAPRGYVLKSTLYRGRDITDIPTEFDGDPAHDVQVVFTNRTAELSGQVLDDSGTPATRATIIRFPADPARWKAQPRFTVGAVSRSGAYRIGLLAAGEYFVVAVSPEEYRALSLPDDYDRLAAVAERVTLLENDRRTADLRLTSVPPRKREP